MVGSPFYMSKLFENQNDRDRELRAIKKFVSIFDGKYQKLGKYEIDFKVWDKKNKLVAFVEVKGRFKLINDAFPLPVALRKIVSLSDCRINPVMIWACDDGIIYGLIRELIGTTRFSGRPVRNGSTNDAEMMAYFENQPNLKIVLYE